MIQLIKKGGLRERANRSRFHKGSENTETALAPNSYKERSNTSEEKMKESSNEIKNEHSEDK